VHQTWGVTEFPQCTYAQEVRREGGGGVHVKGVAEARLDQVGVDEVLVEGELQLGHPAKHYVLNCTQGQMRNTDFISN
jgi:hypothetical protein